MELWQKYKIKNIKYHTYYMDSSKLLIKNGLFYVVYICGSFHVFRFFHFILKIFWILAIQSDLG